MGIRKRSYMYVLRVMRVLMRLLNGVIYYFLLLIQQDDEDTGREYINVVICTESDEES